MDGEAPRLTEGALARALVVTGDATVERGVSNCWAGRGEAANTERGVKKH